MFDGVIDQIKITPKYHPQKPHFKGSFNYQSGSEVTYFFRTGLMFIPNPKATCKKDETIVIPIGLALTVKYIWIDNSWHITIEQTAKVPVRRRRNWIVFK